jgi:hypothetical protein
VTNSIRISICLPSKGRESRLNQMITSAVKTAKSPSNIEFCIYLDESDLFTPINPDNSVIKVFRGPKLSTSTMTNFMYSQSTGDIVMYAADDIIFRTSAWDSIVVNYFDSYPELGLLYGDDLSPNSRRIATHGFLRRSVCQELNYLLPPYFESEFCDTWLTRIFRKSGKIKYIHELVIEHMHPNWGKAYVDETYSFRSKQYRHVYLLAKQYLLFFEYIRDVKILRQL